MAKRMLYFRGKCYEDTLRNRIVANVLTYIYRFKSSLWLIFSYVLFVGCTCVPAEKQGTGFNDSLYIDSLNISGHSYIYAYDHNSISLVHNPDCYCRYNRTFVIIKRGK